MTSIEALRKLSYPSS